MPNSIVLFYIQ